MSEIAYELADLVTGAEVARRLGMSTQRAHQLAARTDFPQPLGRVGNAIVWKWEAISCWARSNMNFEMLPDGSSIVVRELRARGQWVASWYLTGFRGYRTFNLGDEGAPTLATPEAALDWTKQHIVLHLMDD
jgi:predicted DNA-binding transcriptional regulator AlpA